MLSPRQHRNLLEGLKFIVNLGPAPLGCLVSVTVPSPPDSLCSTSPFCRNYVLRPRMKCDWGQTISAPPSSFSLRVRSPRPAQVRCPAVPSSAIAVECQLVSAGLVGGVLSLSALCGLPTPHGPQSAFCAVWPDPSIHPLYLLLFYVQVHPSERK